MVRFKAIAASIFIVAMLSGCNQTSEIKSDRAPGYQGYPRSLLIADNLGDIFFATPFQKNPGQDVRDAITATLKGCGIRVDFQEFNVLTVDDPVPARIATLKPDAVLRIDQRGGSGPNYYTMEMTDLATKSVVWRSNMVFHVPLNETRSHAFAKALIDRLLADRLIPTSCQFN